MARNVRTGAGALAARSRVHQSPLADAQRYHLDALANAVAPQRVHGPATTLVLAICFEL